MGIVARDDVLALRLTLLCAHVAPDVPLLTTLFDRTSGRKLHDALPAVEIISPSALAARDLSAHCARAGARAVPWHRSRLQLVDGALRLLVGAGLGLGLALGLETAASMLALHEGFVDAVYLSARTVATVAAAPEAVHGPAWFKLFSAANMLASLALVAVFTAALVRRVSRPRLTTIWGPCAAPAYDHVLVVGLGQVGFRLGQALRAQGIPVLAVERDPTAPCVRLARKAGIPVAIARGDDRHTLQRLRIERCAVVVAATSDDLVNVSVGLAASDLAPDIAVVMRLGDGEIAAETESLLHLGAISDAHRIAAEALAAALKHLAVRTGPDTTEDDQ
ncbi:NAD-binding protein [Paraconexibacter antarcticus]|uniref:NAD-binding protein n=1 Tax=Paraconexibacter antarcticus TaxID=2949664 RepID=A0ABY5DZ80_9ACTN|nr:NAD(P)-binding protein [Paraconexibacter antarcticus]UTI66850.1 NAD-binding protein [Paraconexibacter antarcticus]